MKTIARLIIVGLTLSAIVSCKKRTFEEPHAQGDQSIPTNSGDKIPGTSKFRISGENEIPAALPRDLIFSVGIDAFRDVEPYHICGTSNCASDFINLIKEEGMSYVRSEIWVDPGYQYIGAAAGGINSNGLVIDCGSNTLKSKIEAYTLNGINIAPVVTPMGWEKWLFNPDTFQVKFPGDNLESRGYLIGKNFANTTYDSPNCAGFGNYFHYYEIMNEMDAQVLNSTNYGVVGDNATDYNTTNLARLKDFFHGLCRGIKESDSTAKCIINASGGPRKYFFQYLTQQGVDFDIVGYHWYSYKGNPSNVALPSGLPIISDNGTNLTNILSVVNSSCTVWMTEVNRSATADITNWTSEMDNYQGDFFKIFFGDLAALNSSVLAKIKCINVHALLNIPRTDRGHENFGIVHSNPYANPSSFEYLVKPAFQSLKFKIEETKYGWHDYISALFKYSHRRSSSEITNAGIDLWADPLYFSNTTVANVSNNFIGNNGTYEYFIKLYRELYKKYTGSETTGSCSTCTSVESVIIAVCTTTAFNNKAHAGYGHITNNRQKEIQHIFTCLNNRGVAPADLANYATAYSTNEALLVHLLTYKTPSGTTPDFYAEETRRYLIIDCYDRYLSRMADEGGLNFFLTKLVSQAGYGALDMTKEILSSEEFWLRAIKEGYENRQSPFQYPFVRRKFDLYKY